MLCSRYVNWQQLSSPETRASQNRLTPSFLLVACIAACRPLPSAFRANRCMQRLMLNSRSNHVWPLLLKQLEYHLPNFRYIEISTKRYIAFSIYRNIEKRYIESFDILKYRPNDTWYIISNAFCPPFPDIPASFMPVRYWTKRLTYQVCTTWYDSSCHISKSYRCAFPESVSNIVSYSYDTNLIFRFFGIKYRTRTHRFAFSFHDILSTHRPRLSFDIHHYVSMLASPGAVVTQYRRHHSSGTAEHTKTRRQKYTQQKQRPNEGQRATGLFDLHRQGELNRPNMPGDGRPTVKT